MARIDTVLLKVASRCNIDCDYCYVYRLGDTGYARQPKIMSEETIRACVRSLADLPETARRYVTAVEEHAGAPIVLVSVGPERTQTIERAWRPMRRRAVGAGA